jgi:AraC-like DNA-binding protein
MAVRTTGSRELIIFREDELRMPGLRCLAVSRNRRPMGSEAGLAAHRHIGWELCWVRTGLVDRWSSAGVAEIGPGWCYLTPPGTLHGTLTGGLEPCELWWIQLDPVRLPGLDRSERAALIAALSCCPSSFPAGDLLGPWQDALAAAGALAQAGGSPLARLGLRACLHRLLVAALVRPPARPLPARLERAMHRAEEGPAGVGTLARIAGCSPSALGRLFRTWTGEGTRAWLQRQRLREAKRRLAATAQDITAIALDLGFPSSQHFATSFRQATGLTPTRYRRLTGERAVDGGR